MTTSHHTPAPDHSMHHGPHVCSECQAAPDGFGHFGLYCLPCSGL